MPISTVKPVDLFVGAPDPRQAWTSTALATSFYRLSAFQVMRPVQVTTANFHVGTAASSIDIGIYRDDGAGNLTRIASTGSFVCPAAGARTQALTASVALVPGVRYYAAVVADNATVALYAALTGVVATFMSAERVSGFVAGAIPLPASLTFDTASSTSVSGFLIYFT